MEEATRWRLPGALLCQDSSFRPPKPIKRRPPPLETLGDHRHPQSLFSLRFLRRPETLTPAKSSRRWLSSPRSSTVCPRSSASMLRTSRKKESSRGAWNWAHLTIPFRQSSPELSCVSSPSFAINSFDLLESTRVSFRFGSAPHCIKLSSVSVHHRRPQCTTAGSCRRRCPVNQFLAALLQLGSSLCSHSSSVCRSSREPPNHRLRRSPVLIWGQSTLWLCPCPCGVRPGT
jgi:hypothetical protein